MILTRPGPAGALALLILLAPGPAAAQPRPAGEGGTGAEAAPGPASAPAVRPPRIKQPSFGQGQEDSRDEAIFGADDADAGQDLPGAAPAAPGSRPVSRDDDVLGESRTPDLERRLLSLGTDRLQIGGLLYIRSNLAITDGDRVEDHRLSMPNLLDVYLDGRPSEHVRGFFRGRLTWDPTIDESGAQAQLGGAKQTTVALDELWIKLDIARRLFITVGQQKVRWGTTQLWNPVDVVNATQRPLLNPFDARPGVPLIKLHLPIESYGWNFYLAGVLDRVDSLDQAGVVGRAEFVFSTVEAALTGAYRDGVDPRLGLDFSAGVWDFDLKAEACLRFDDRFSRSVSLQVAAGLLYSIAVFDKDMMILSGEYFYNQEGTDQLNPLDLYSGKVQYFYAGRHYAALSALLPRPGSLDDWTFALSAIGNLSDLSFIIRTDISIRVLTYLSVSAYFAGHLGEPGELVLGDSAFPAAVRALARQMLSPDDPTRRIPTQLFDLGLWLSIDL